MPIPAEVLKCYKYIDAHAKSYIDDLREIVKVPNISSDPASNKDIKHLIMWMTDKLKDLNFQTVLKRPEGKKYQKNKVPPVIIASLKSNSWRKKTLLYYCHLDVLKVQWTQSETPPFELTEKDGRLYGRGTVAMKGPLLCFLHAIESYQKLGIEIPINIKIICESMFECRSRGLTSILEQQKTNFLSDVDCVLITDSKWIGKDYPCIVYGMRGVSYFNMTIEGPSKDLNSGEFGGITREPMQDMLYIVNNLIDMKGKILIPNFYEDIVQVTPEEEGFYKQIKIDAKEYTKNMGVYKLGHNENLKTALMHVWRYPWFNIHYIDNSCEEFNLLNIPKKVFIRFSLRTVPNQTHEKMSKLIIDYIHETFKKVDSPNKLDVHTEDFLDPWYENHLHWNYEAANRATKQVYKEEASFIREGNGFPIVLKLRDVLPKRNILILPLVDCESKRHSDEENISIRCYIESTKILVSYFWELNDAAKRYHRGPEKLKPHQDPCQ